jgi:hypothetical protein
MCVSPSLCLSLSYFLSFFLYLFFSLFFLFHTPSILFHFSITFSVRLSIYSHLIPFTPYPSPLLLFSPPSLHPFIPPLGALTPAELKVRFSVVRNAVRQESYVPEGANNVVGQVAGYVFSQVVSAPRYFW